MGLDLHIGRVGDARIAALVAADGLMAVAAESWHSPDVTGAVYRARYKRFDAAADLSIVDLGAFEAVVPGRVAEATSFPVQVKRHPRDGKRAEATTDLVLAGRFLMAAPAIGDVKTSSRLRNGKAQRDRAVGLGLSAGWILRRGFSGADDQAVLADARRLSAMVRQVQAGGDLGMVLPPPPIWCRVALDDGEPARLFASADVSKSAQSDLGRLGLDIPIVGPPADLAEMIDPLLQAEVALPRGGRLTIEPTRALTAIDVDAGGATHEAANQAAVNSIARQLRLRNIGGIVVIDLVSQKSDWRPVVDSLRHALADDPARTSIAGGVSPLGLMQLSRERRGPSLAEVVGPSK